MSDHAYSEYPDDNEFVANARAGDPSTSHAAAEAVNADEDQLKQAVADVLHVMREHGPDDDTRLYQAFCAEAEAGTVKPQVSSGFRTRRCFLVRNNLAHDTGRKQRNLHGGLSIVWAAGPSPTPLATVTALPLPEQENIIDAARRRLAERANQRS